MSVYTHMINGPRQSEEEGGPTHLYVILVDNGRTDIYNSTYVQALTCIRCGACINICPVYEAVGGHTYGWVYPGPIGAVITPLLTGLENASPLPYASSLCGACKEVCPVDIDLPRMLLDLRHELVLHKKQSVLWRAGLRMWGMVARSPRWFRLMERSARWGSKLLPRHHKIPVPPLSGWTQSRDLPEIAAEPFREWWAKRDQGGSHD